MYKSFKILSNILLIIALDVIGVVDRVRASGIISEQTTECAALHVSTLPSSLPSVGFYRSYEIYIPPFLRIIS